MNFLYMYKFHKYFSLITNTFYRKKKNRNIIYRLNCCCDTIWTKNTR